MNNYYDEPIITDRVTDKFQQNVSISVLLQVQGRNAKGRVPRLSLVLLHLSPSLPPTSFTCKVKFGAWHITSVRTVNPNPFPHRFSSSLQ